jgi:hypothetical protein
MGVIRLFLLLRFHNSKVFYEEGLALGIYFAPSFSRRDAFGNGGVK